jgi:hypothetical protein
MIGDECKCTARGVHHLVNRWPTLCTAAGTRQEQTIHVDKPPHLSSHVCL